MTYRVCAILIVVVLSHAPAALADYLEKGDRELSFSLSFSDLDFDASSVGDSDSTELTATFGYLLTDHHEVGVGAAVFEGNGSSSSILVLFYSYNFRAAANVNPYIGGQFLAYNGDIGDLFDTAYGLVAGIKVFPWSHGGFFFGVSYREIQGASSVLDATELNAFSGLRVKF